MMNYYLPAIRLLPTIPDSLLVQMQTSTSYDNGGLTAVWTAGNSLSSYLKIINIKYTIYNIKALLIARFNLNQLCARASYEPGAYLPSSVRPRLAF